MIDPMTISPQQMLACVQKEVERRRRAYPRSVLAGSMTADAAELGIAEMRAVMEVVRVAVEADAKGMFGERQANR